MTSKTEKLRKILIQLKFHMLSIDDIIKGESRSSERFLDYDKKPYYWITRKQLRELIIHALGYLSRPTIYNWIDFLLGDYFIEPNPTSEKSAHKGKLLPCNDTRYVINKDKIQLLFTHPKKQTKQSSLTSSLGPSQNNLANRSMNEPTTNFKGPIPSKGNK